MANNFDKEKAVEVAVTQIERQFGKGAIMKLRDQAKVTVDVISTGSISFPDAWYRTRWIFPDP